jgi:hypothetical protein
MRGRCVIASHDQSPVLVHRGFPTSRRPTARPNTCVAKLFVSISCSLLTARAETSRRGHLFTRKRSYFRFESDARAAASRLMTVPIGMASAFAASA